MNREFYFAAINERLSTLAVMVDNASSLNIDSLNIHSESFYVNFFNLLFGNNFHNINAEKQNFTSIDLIDETSKKIIQVTATATKHKIESTLSKEILKKYQGFSFQFIFIGTASINGLVRGKFSNPHNMLFDPNRDIFDKKKILSVIINLDIDKLRDVYTFIKKELKPNPDIVQMDSCLTMVIKALAEESFENNENPNLLNFDIEDKITFNGLSSQREFFKDYIIYTDLLEKKYQEFDRYGKNTKLSILNTIHTIYRKLKQTETNSNTILERIIDETKQKALDNDLGEVSEELLELCVQVIITDAFVRCKIFENPEGYKHAFTR